ncbi:hypothetical protein JD969_00885 [Planctomycetota bacterium]|nr:hypothetical protein JD969_00885 [Planctomycetota bacterium]
MLNQSSNIFVDAYTGDRSGIIMLCDCIPDDLGDAQQKRAYAILSQMHDITDIHLIMTAKSSLNLLQWRWLNEHTTSLELLPRFSLSRSAHIRNSLQGISTKSNIIFCQNLRMLPKQFASSDQTIIYDHSFHTQTIKKSQTWILDECTHVFTSKHAQHTLPASLIEKLNVVQTNDDCVNALTNYLTPVSIVFNRAKQIIESEQTSERLLVQAA